MVEIIENKQEWNSFLKEMVSFDFYHSYEYHNLFKKEGQSPILIIYSDEKIKIGFPFLKRKIYDTEYFDLTSVFGYLGPVMNTLSDYNYSQLHKELNEFLFKNNCVAAFSKLNPFLPKQENVLGGIGDISEVGVLVYIDLTLQIEEQYKGYQKNLKRHLKKARKFCYVKRAESNEEIEAFRKIYYENMDRIEADKSVYYHPKEYFYNLINSDLFDVDIYVAVFEETNEIIAGVMYVKTSNIIQAQLIATASDFIYLSPSKLVIDEMRIIATQEKKHLFLNLGGGFGGLKGSLVSGYKLPFSKEYMLLKVWKYIINDDVYNTLVKENLASSPDNDFFPMYRSKKN